MPFQVELERKADRDIADVEAKLLRVGLPSLARWRNRLLRVVRELERDPHAFPEASEAAELGISLNEALFGRRPHIYRVLFTIDGNTVVVHRVRHAAQDWLTPDDL